MGWIFALSIRNVFRNKRRSLLTTLTVVLGTALLTLGLSWLNGVMGMLLGGATKMAGEARVVTTGYALREASLPLYEHIASVRSVQDEIEASLEGTDTYALIRTGVSLSVGEEIGEHFGLLVAADQEYFQEVMDLNSGVEKGHFFSGREGEVLLGRVLAGQLEAEVGQELIVLGRTQDGSPSPLKLSVRGIVNGGNSLADRQVYVPLDVGQWLADVDDSATELLVYGKGYLAADSLAEDLRAMPRLQAFSVTSWKERDPYRGIYTTVSLVFGVLAFIVVFVTALGVLNTMIMSVLERTSEVGVLRALGLKKSAAIGMFLMEGLLIGVVGAAIGLGIGMIPSLFLETHGIVLAEGLTSKTGFPLASSVHANFTGGIAVWSAGLGVLTSLLGALIPAVRAAAIQPVEAMRRRR